MNAEKLRKKAQAYSRKKYRNKIVGIYRGIKHDCKREAKKGSYTTAYHTSGVWDETGHFPEALIATRLFRLKHKDFTVRIDEHGSYTNSEGKEMPCKWRVVVSWY